MIHTAYILLGGNLGDVQQHFKDALTAIESVAQIVNLSSIVESEPWGFESENLFLNQVIKIETSLSPLDLLQFNKKIELYLGREKANDTTSYSSRPIDIDILYYNDVVIESEQLQIPHPRLHLRNFTLVPLVEIAPDYIHPVLLKSNQELLNTTPDTSKVRKM